MSSGTDGLAPVLRALEDGDGVVVCPGPCRPAGTVARDVRYLTPGAVVGGGPPGRRTRRGDPDLAAWHQRVSFL